MVSILERGEVTRILLSGFCLLDKDRVPLTEHCSDWLLFPVQLSWLLDPLSGFLLAGEHSASRITVPLHCACHTELVGPS